MKGIRLHRKGGVRRHVWLGYHHSKPLHHQRQLRVSDRTQEGALLRAHLHTDCLPAWLPHARSARACTHARKRAHTHDAVRGCTRPHQAASAHRMQPMQAWSGSASVGMATGSPSESSAVMRTSAVSPVPSADVPPSGPAAKVCRKRQRTLQSTVALELAICAWQVPECVLG